VCVRARLFRSFFSYFCRPSCFLRKKRRKLSHEKFINPLFHLHRRRRRRRHFCFASITLFLSLRRGKKGPLSPFRRRRRTPPRLRPKQSSFGSKERDFECFVVWFSLSTSSIQNSGANKKSYTYSIVLEKGPLDTHHGASFLGPRTVDAV
jgi:hypothetical protein